MPANLSIVTRPSLCDNDGMSTPITARTLIVKLTCGAEAAERANQAWTVAAMALAAGAPVTVWVTGEAVLVRGPGRQPDLALPHATPVADLVETVRTGGRIVVCTQCAARRELTGDDLVDGATSPVRRALSRPPWPTACRRSSTGPVRRGAAPQDASALSSPALGTAGRRLSARGGEPGVERGLAADLVGDLRDLAVEVVGLDVAGASGQRLPGRPANELRHARDRLHGEARRPG